MRKALAGLMVVAALAALPACGGKTDETARAAGIAPATALAFMTLSLDPSIEQKRNLLSIAKAFPGAKVRGEFEDTRDDALDELLEDSGLDYQRDVKPWLGNEIAAVALPGSTPEDVPTVVVMVQVEDQDKAEAALKKAKAKDPSVGTWRFVDDFVLLVGQGQKGGAAALDVIEKQAKGDAAPLADTKQFSDPVAELHGDRLLLAWFDAKRLAEAAKKAVGGEIPQFDFAKQLGKTGPVAMDFHAAPKAFVLEAAAHASSPSKGNAPRLAESLPAATLAALTFFDLGGGLTDALTQTMGMTTDSGEGEAPDPAAIFKEATGLDLEADVLSWMQGELSIAVGPAPAGEDIPDFAIVVDPTDRAKAEASVPKIRAALAREAGEGAIVDRQIAGVTASVVAEPVQGTVQPAMALFADRFVIASRPAYLEAVSKKSAESLGESAPYRSVVSSGSSGKTQFQLLIRIDPVRELLERVFNAADDADYQKDVKPNLVPLDVFGARSYRVGEWDRFELKLTVS